jgi:hypothetical protein
VRADILELTDSELGESLEAFAALVREEMAAPRTAEIISEAAKRLKARK